MKNSLRKTAAARGRTAIALALAAAMVLSFFGGFAPAYAEREVYFEEGNMDFLCQDYISAIPCKM